MEKVFITGRGLITPLGNGLAANEAALRSGKSGISVVPEFVEKRLTSIVGGIPDHWCLYCTGNHWCWIVPF